jgi:DNA-binding response OmpR family regulator
MSRRNRNRQSNDGDNRDERRQDNQKQQQKNGEGGGGKKQSSRHGRRRGRGGGGRNPKANMVILVDNDHDYVEMESKAVVNYVSGYNPMGFNDAARAISYLSNPRNQGRIGLVMLNIDLPGQEEDNSIRELIEMLSSDDNALLSVVCENNGAQAIERAMAVGANGVLTKPFTIERFVRFVKGILRNSGSTSWQCETCGKLVVVDQIDMLKMKPIKCSDRECGLADLKQIDFPPEG